MNKFELLEIIPRTSDQDATMMITYEGSVLFIDEKTLELDYPIAEVLELDGSIVILLGPDSYKSRFGQFENVVAVSREGRELWKAELPTSSSGDRYYKIFFDEGLKASSVFSYLCELDPQTGRILRKEFLK